MGRDVNAAQKVCDIRGRNKIVRVGKSPVPFFAVCGPKFMTFFGQCRRPSVFSSALARLSVSRLVQKIFAIKCRSRPKIEQM